VAEHYAARRNVPADRIIGLDLPADETMSRADYRKQLQEPLLDFLERKKLLVYRLRKPPPTRAMSFRSRPRCVYAVLCYGVPCASVKTLAGRTRDGTVSPAGLRRNGAAVDSELCTLPVRRPSRPLTGFVAQCPLRDRLPAVAGSHQRIADGGAVGRPKRGDCAALGGQGDGGRKATDCGAAPTSTLRGLTNGKLQNRR